MIHHRGSNPAVALLLALLILSLAAGPAEAHNLAIGQSKIVQDGDVVRYDLAVAYAELSNRIPVLAAGTPEPGADDADRLAALRASRTAVGRYVGTHVDVLRDGVACDETLEAVDTVRHRGVLFAVLQLAYRCPASGPGPYAVRYRLFFDDRSAADHTAHASVVDYRLGGVEGRFVFEPATQQLQVGQPRRSSSSSAPLGVVGSGALIALVLTLLLAWRLRRRRIPPRQAAEAYTMTLSG